MSKKYVKHIINKFFVVMYYEENWDDPYYGATQKRIFVDRETATDVAEYLAEEGPKDGIYSVMLYTGIIDDGEIVPDKLIKDYDEEGGEEE